MGCTESLLTNAKFADVLLFTCGVTTLHLEAFSISAQLEEFSDSLSENRSLSSEFGSFVCLVGVVNLHTLALVSVAAAKAKSSMS